jgi:hypothetical protein
MHEYLIIDSELGASDIETIRIGAAVICQSFLIATPAGITAFPHEDAPYLAQFY